MSAWEMGTKVKHEDKERENGEYVNTYNTSEDDCSVSIQCFSERKKKENNIGQKNEKEKMGESEREKKQRRREKKTNGERWL